MPTPKVSGVVLTAMLLLPGYAAAQSNPTAAQLRQLQKVIEEQQRQLDALKQQVEQLSRAQTDVKASAAETDKKVEQVRAQVGEKPLVESGSKNIKLAISGQINRAMNVAGDGRNTKLYFVDNDVSNSRLRVVGTGEIYKGTTLGTTIEVAISPNNSYDVSQDNEDAGDFIDERKVEVWARNDGFGRVMFGKGQAAADDTAEYDLSLVGGPIMYAGVADIAGGLLFSEGGSYSTVTIGDAFNDLDGNRQDRIRYDSPMFGPAQLSFSAGSDQRWDAALTFGGDYGDWTGFALGPFTNLAAVSIRDPSDDGVDYQVAGSWSMLHNPSGLSLTLSGGMIEGDGDTPYNLYGKIGWDTAIFAFGNTGFGLDYTHSENISAEGDKANSFGIAAVQLIKDYGVELYGQLRLYTLDRGDGPNFDDIVVGTLGTRVKF